MSTTEINPGEIWIHHNGFEYEVIGLANVANHNPDYPPCVVYKGLNGSLWTKTIENFLKKMTKRSLVEFKTSVLFHFC